MTTVPASPLMTTREAMLYLRISRDVLDQERREGRLAYVQARPGGKIHFRQADLDAWISRMVHPARLVETRATYRKPRQKGA